METEDQDEHCTECGDILDSADDDDICADCKSAAEDEDQFDDDYEDYPALDADEMVR